MGCARVGTSYKAIGTAADMAVLATPSPVTIASETPPRPGAATWPRPSQPRPRPPQPHTSDGAGTGSRAKPGNSGCVRCCPRQASRPTCLIPAVLTCNHARFRSIIWSSAPCPSVPRASPAPCAYFVPNTRSPGCPASSRLWPTPPGRPRPPGPRPRVPGPGSPPPDARRPTGTRRGATDPTQTAPPSPVHPLRQPQPSPATPRTTPARPPPPVRSPPHPARPRSAHLAPLNRGGQFRTDWIQHGCATAAETGTTAVR